VREQSARKVFIFHIIVPASERDAPFWLRDGLASGSRARARARCGHRARDAPHAQILFLGNFFSRFSRSPARRCAKPYLSAPKNAISRTAEAIRSDTVERLRYILQVSGFAERKRKAQDTDDRSDRATVNSPTGQTPKDKINNALTELPARRGRAKASDKVGRKDKLPAKRQKQEKPLAALRREIRAGRQEP